jgi:hypothetical protein
MKLKYLAALGVVAVVAVPAAYGMGLFQTLPIIGGASYCASSNVSGAAQGTVTGTGGGTASAGQTTGTVICGQTVPAGPTALTGTEVVPVDLYTPGTAQIAGGPATAVLPVTALGNGYGGTTVLATTGTTALVAASNGISNLVYAGSGTATYTTLNLPPNPFQNEQFCVRNAGSGILSIGTLAVGTTGQSIVGVTPTSIPVATAVGTAGTVTLSANCWIYNVANTTWYRVL